MKRAVLLLALAAALPLRAVDINDTRLLKQQLMAELSSWITEHQLRQVDAAQILMVSRPRVSDVVNQKTAKFTIDTLVEMLSRVGKPVRLAVG